MMKMRLLPLLLLAAAGAWAQPGDPLKSPECGQAREALDQARAAAEQDPAKAAQVEPLRKQAARICLGVTDDTAPSGRVAQPPQRVPAPVITPPQRPPVFAAPTLPPPPVIERPPVITACDPGGCWDSNGTRLNRAGPNLIGPSGLCTVQGTLLSCQ